MNTQDSLKIIRAKIKLAKEKEAIKIRSEIRKDARLEEKKEKKFVEARDKAVKKFLKTPVVYKKVLKPSERVGVVLNYQKQEPKSIKNFINASMIRGNGI